MLGQVPKCVIIVLVLETVIRNLTSSIKARVRTASMQWNGSDPSQATEDNEITTAPGKNACFTLLANRAFIYKMLIW